MNELGIRDPFSLKRAASAVNFTKALMAVWSALSVYPGMCLGALLLTRLDWRKFHLLRLAYMIAIGG